MTIPHAPQSPLPQADAQTRVLRQFRIVFSAIRGHFKEVESKTGLGGAQLWALGAIHAADGCGVNELALAMDIHQSTASNLVKSLSKRGLLQARRDERDRRAVLLSLTAEGQAMLRKAPGPVSGVMPAALARLDPATLARLEQDLAALITLIDADQSLAQKPLASA